MALLSLNRHQMPCKLSRNAPAEQMDHKQNTGKINIYTMSQKTSHLWFAITLTHVKESLYFFCRNVIDKVCNQKTLYYATSINLCFCTTSQNKEMQKLHFSLNAALAHCLNSTSCLISSIFLTHDSYSCCCMTT